MPREGQRGKGTKREPYRLRRLVETGQRLTGIFGLGDSYSERVHTNRAHLEGASNQSEGSSSVEGSEGDSDGNFESDEAEEVVSGVTGNTDLDNLSTADREMGDPAIAAAVQAIAQGMQRAFSAFDPTVSRQNLPLFFGHQKAPSNTYHTTDVAELFSLLDKRYASAQTQLSEAEKIRLLTEQLRGDAKILAQSSLCSELTTYDEVRGTILGAYKPRHELTILQDALFHAKRRPGESLLQFAVRLLSVADKIAVLDSSFAPLGENQAKSSFVRALPAQIRDFLDVAGGDSIIELANKAQKHANNHEELGLTEKSYEQERVKQPSKMETVASLQRTGGYEQWRRGRGHFRRAVRGGYVNRGRETSRTGTTVQDTNGEGHWQNGSRAGFRGRGHWRGQNTYQRGYNTYQHGSRRGTGAAKFYTTRGKGPQCYNCNNYGHLARDCDFSPTKGSVPRCYYCHQYGHLARDCVNAEGEVNTMQMSQGRNNAVQGQAGSALSKTQAVSALNE